MFEFMADLKRNPKVVKRLELYENGFFDVSPEQICLAEKFLGYELPVQLRAFYLEVGEGRLQTGRNGRTSDFNNVASPDDLVAIQNGTSDWLMPYTEIEPDTLPFFERDVDLFL